MPERLPTTTTSSAFHEARPPISATQMVRCEPVVRSKDLTSPGMEKPTERPSGAQNGSSTRRPAVPSSGVASSSSMERSHSWLFSRSPARKTSWRPSGESATAVMIEYWTVHSRWSPTDVTIYIGFENWDEWESVCMSTSPPGNDEQGEAELLLEVLQQVHDLGPD